MSGCLCGHDEWCANCIPKSASPGVREDLLASALAPEMLDLLRRLSKWRVNPHMNPGKAEDDMAGFRGEAAAMVARIEGRTS